MGNKQEKESAKANFDECKREYFKAINKDLKDTMRKINDKINENQDPETRNKEKESWVDYLKQKFSDYVNVNKNLDIRFQQIFIYLDNIGETNESKHTYSLSLFLKTIYDDSMKIKQRNCKL